MGRAAWQRVALFPFAFPAILCLPRGRSCGAVLRYYFAFILAVGLGASLLTNNSGSPAITSDQDRPATLTVTAVTPVGEFRQAGDGLTLQRQYDGHFYADAQINGTTVRMLVDTGASGIALTRDDARKAGIGISIGMPNVVGQGAGGAVKGEYVMLDRVSLGSASAQSVPAVVLDGGGQSLLGQSFLSKFASVEMRGDTMVLR